MANRSRAPQGPSSPRSRKISREPASRGYSLSRRAAFGSALGGLAAAGVAMTLSSLDARTPVASAPTVSPVSTSPMPTSQPLPPQPSNEKGPPDAPVHMVDFSSYTCPHCASFALTVEPAIDEHYVEPGLLHFRFVHSPFDPFALRASEAVETAGAQGAFWPYHYELMLHQRDLVEANYVDAALERLAIRLGLDVDRFRLDLNAHRYLPLVEAAMRESADNDIRGVPTFLIGEARITGSRPFEQLAQVIDDALARSGRA